MIDVEKLIRRGDRFSINKGRLQIVPESGGVVPGDWLKKHERQITTEILEKLNMDALIYLGFDKGVFRGRYEGIHLQFESLLKSTSHYCLFNAEVKYCRGPKIGQLLPGKQFRVGKRSEFLKFWRRIGLEPPQRRGSFHDYMGNLKSLLFTARPSENEKLEKQTLGPLSISHDEVQAAFVDVPPYSNHTEAIQVPYKTHTRKPYNESRETQVYQELEPFQTAGNFNRGIRSYGNTVTRGNVIPRSAVRKSPEEQTVDEWLAEYEAAENLNFSNDFR